MKNKDEQIKTFVFPFLSGIEAVSGKNIVNDFRRHIHKKVIIGIVISGVRMITCGNESLRISENEMFILNSGQPHACRPEGPLGNSYKILSASIETLKAIASQISEKPEPAPRFKNILYGDKSLSEDFLKLFDIFESPESMIQIESGLLSFLSRLLMRFAEFPPLMTAFEIHETAVERVLKYIAGNYKKNPSLSELAEIACQSPFHFQRVFTKKMGLTPHEYIRDFKISESRKMLLKTEDIAGIAHELGFTDQSHFTRVFRKTVGVPPGKFADVNRNITVS